MTMSAVIAASVLPCWSCKGPVAGGALFCSVCGAVQGPAGGVDHFARLGLGPRFEIDFTELEQKYFALQRRLHPDRFASRSPRERALSQQQATQVNEAYETLKDPLKRAVYLLGLLGHPVDMTACGTINDPELLMEQMEKREAIAEADSVAEIARLSADADAEVLACQCHIATAFNQGDLARAAHLTLRLKYLVKLAEDARVAKTRMTRRMALPPA